MSGLREWVGQRDRVTEWVIERVISYVSEGMSKQVSEKNYELSKLAWLRNKILQSGNVVSIIVVSTSMKSVNPGDNYNEETYHRVHGKRHISPHFSLV